MVRSVIPTGADAPHVRAEDQDGQKKKDAHNLKPKRAAHVRERAQKTGEAANQSAAGAARGLAGFAADWAGGGNRLRRMNLAAGLGLSGKPLARNAACNANSDAENAAYGFGSHP